MSWHAEALRSLAAAMPQDLEGVRAAGARVHDWNGLVLDAERHGLAGILRRELDRAGVEVPPEAARRLDDSLSVQRLRQTRLDETLVEVLRLLGAAGVPCACLKGPLLGQRLYGEAALRPSADLDLLLAEADLDRAAAALGAAGFQAAAGPTSRWYRRHHHHLGFSRHGAPEVELHFRALVGFGSALPAEELLGRAVPCAFRGTAARVLAPEDEALYLAVHAAGHGLGRLVWLYDLKSLALDFPALDWEEVVRRAAASGLRRAAAFALAGAGALGAPVPRAASALPRLRAGLAERARRAALAWDRPWSTAAGLALQALLADRLLGAAGLLAVNLARAARRRTRRALGPAVPEEWSA